MAKKVKPPPINPFTQADYDRLQGELSRKDQILELMEQAESCGVPCKQYREQLDAAIAGIEHVIATFFPNGRPRA
jgi:hypothetical protein